VFRTPSQSKKVGFRNMTSARGQTGRGGARRPPSNSSEHDEEREETETEFVSAFNEAGARPVLNKRATGAGLPTPHLSGINKERKRSLEKEGDLGRPPYEFKRTTSAAQGFMKPTASSASRLTSRSPSPTLINPAARAGRTTSNSSRSPSPTPAIVYAVGGGSRKVQKGITSMIPVAKRELRALVIPETTVGFRPAGEQVTTLRSGHQLTNISGEGGVRRRRSDPIISTHSAEHSARQESGGY